ncbi:MAG TPA: cytochrome P450, partial [Pseudomonadales bacterium]|nr:cytochrome P450 [Pseudomonadales bacterium]
MSTAISKVYSWSMQAGLQAMVMMDRLWGNLIIDPSLKASPHLLIARLRPKGSILRSYMINGWAVISHEGVKALLRDKRLSSEVFESALIQRVIRSAAQGLVTPIIDYPNIVNLDPPDHTRLRKLAAQSFTSRFIQSLTPKINALVSELLDEVAGNEEVEVMDVLARPLPAIVIAEMLGVPAEERHYFEQWSAALIKYAEILSADAIHEAVLGDLAMRAYLQELVDLKRTHPGQDLISALIEAEEDGDKLDIEELLSLCTVLLVAGHETTTRLIS